MAVAIRPSTYARVRPSAGTTRAEHALLARLVDEATLDARLGRAVAHQRRIRPASQQELEGFDHQGLAGAGLAGQGDEAIREQEGQVVDDPEVRDAQLDEHPAYRSARPNLAFRI